MNCPKCGHPEAECIIGNYWKCPGCDGPEAAHIAETDDFGSYTLVMNVLRGAPTLWPEAILSSVVEAWPGYGYFRARVGLLALLKLNDIFHTPDSDAVVLTDGNVFVRVYGHPLVQHGDLYVCKG